MYFYNGYLDNKSLGKMKEHSIEKLTRDLRKITSYKITRSLYSLLDWCKCTCAIVSIPSESRFTGAVKWSLGIVTQSILAAVVDILSALVYICKEVKNLSKQ